MPASTCARPPYASARPNTTGSPLSDTRPALNMLRTNVVSANAARPSGPGSAIGVGTNETFCRALGAAVGSVSAAASARTVRRSETDEASIWTPPVDTGTGERARSTGCPSDATHEPGRTRAGPAPDRPAGSTSNGPLVEFGSVEPKPGRVCQATDSASSE